MFSNADLKNLSALKERAGRKEQGLFFIEGTRAVVEAMTGDAPIRQLIVSLGANLQKLSEVLSLAGEKYIKIEELPDAKFRKLSATETTQGVIAVAAVREQDMDRLLAEIRPKRTATVLLLDRVSDPGNLGTILRSAAWFGIDGVFIAGGSVDVYNPKVVRSAMAAICQLEVVQDVSLSNVIAGLKKLGFEIVASTHDARTSYAEIEYAKRCAVLFGSEAAGISQELLESCDTEVGIPRIGKMESLNVGVAASIVLSEIARRSSEHRRNT